MAKDSGLTPLDDEQMSRFVRGFLEPFVALVREIADSQGLTTKQLVTELGSKKKTSRTPRA